MIGLCIQYLVVYHNVDLEAQTSTDSWSANNCMGRRTSHLPYLRKHQSDSSTTKSQQEYTRNVNSIQAWSNWMDPIKLDIVIVATSPDSYSFQHSLDRVKVVWSQAQHAFTDQSQKESSTIVLISQTVPKSMSRTCPLVEFHTQL